MLNHSNSDTKYIRDLIDEISLKPCLKNIKFHSGVSLFSTGNKAQNMVRFKKFRHSLTTFKFSMVPMGVINFFGVKATPYCQSV